MKKICKFSLSVSIILVTLLSVAYFNQVSAQTMIRLGIVSDSSSDEYRADDNRAGGTQWAATTLAWTELLAKYRSFDLGGWGTRSEPRRTGYEYNWSRSGARTRDMISSGMHTGIAQQITQGKIDLVYLQLGNNDFGWWKASEGYEAIYNGTENVSEKVSKMLADYRMAIETIQAASPNIPIIFDSVVDINQSPYVLSRYPDAAKRQRVSDAIKAVNQGIAALASEKNVYFMDSEAIARDLLGKIDSTGNLVILNEKISFSSTGDEPHHLVLGDNIHGGTVAEGLFANYFIDIVNDYLNTSISRFSDIEILQNAGIQVAGVPTATPVPTATVTPRATATDAPDPSATPIDEITPTVTPNSCPEDINDDAFIDISDYSILVNSFLAEPPLDARADIDGDGIADLTDYSRLVGKFLQSCE